MFGTGQYLRAVLEAQKEDFKKLSSIFNKNRHRYIPINRG